MVGILSGVWVGRASHTTRFAHHVRLSLKRRTLKWNPPYSACLGSDPYHGHSPDHEQNKEQVGDENNIGKQICGHSETAGIASIFVKEAKEAGYFATGLAGFEHHSLHDPG